MKKKRLIWMIWMMSFGKRLFFLRFGILPGSVDRDWRREIDALEAWRGRGIVAVGEIGLDYHYGAEFKREQQEAFRVQLELAAAWDLPVNIHLREATEDFFAILGECRHLGLRGNLHAFSGSIETFRRLSRYGDWRIGVGGVVTFCAAMFVAFLVLGYILFGIDRLLARMGSRHTN